MPITFRPLGPHIAAEMSGVDLTIPLSAEDIAAIHAGMDKYAVLVVRQQPLTGDQQLAFSRSLGELESSHAGKIIGWPVQEALTFLRDLTEHATQPQFVYVHEWQVGDLVMWDNRETMHRARRFPPHEPRDMRRTTLVGDGPTAEQA
jgi:alpha-ketoglutarate-dependent 2,4-dichlorophenoxyacetate dioxygenase